MSTSSEANSDDVCRPIMRRTLSPDAPSVTVNYAYWTSVTWVRRHSLGQWFRRQHSNHRSPQPLPCRDWIAKALNAFGRWFFGRNEAESSATLARAQLGHVNRHLNDCFG